ncbi:MAG: hypothetical protein QME40_00745 [bacterium]|nr:hypothetical protein [bacterium]
MISNLFVVSKIISLFLLVYILFPSLFIKKRKGDSILDKFFVNLTHMTFITLLLVHFLVLLHIYEPLSLYGGYLLVGIGFIIYRRKWAFFERLSNFFLRVVSSFLDVLDQGVDLVKVSKEYLIEKKGRVLDRIRSCDRSNLIYLLSFIPVMGYAAYLRFYDSFRHEALGTSDPYVWIKVMKDMEMNRLFLTGIHPEGFASFLSSIHFFTYLDPVYIFKFMGPFISLLTVLSCYWITNRLTGSKGASLISSFIYGIFIYGGTIAEQLPLGLYRQTTTLPQEFGALFLLPTLYFMLRYIVMRKARYLLLSCEGLVIIFRVHSIVGLMAMIGMVSILLSGIIARLWTKKTLISVLLAFVASLLLGHLSILLGFLSGYKLHESALGFFTLFTPQFRAGALDLSGLLYVILAINLFLIGYGITIKDRIDKFDFLSFTIFLLFLFFQYKANFFGIRHVVCPYSTGHFLSLLISIPLGLFYYILTSKILGRILIGNYRQFGAAISVILLLGIAFPGKPPESFKMEYDGMIRGYLRISKMYTPYEWLIVSTTEEYPLCLKKGWHMHIEDFLSRYNPQDDLPIEIPHIFIFTEKKGFRVKEGGIEIDYRWRDDFQRRINEWCQVYSIYHRDMDIFYEDENITIYAIHKEVSRPKPLWKEDEPTDIR